MAIDQKERRWAPVRKVEISKLFDKLPPHAPEAEAAVLGSIMIDPQVCGDVIQLLRSPDDFYQESHSLIYQAMLELYEAGQPMDYVPLISKLKDLKVADDIQAQQLLVEIAESVPSASSAVYYAEIVRDKAMVRRLIQAAGKILDDCYNAGYPTRDLLDIAEQAIFKIADQGETTQASQLIDLLQETYELLQSRDGRGISGLETGYFELDEMLNGLQPSEMVIIAARPSMGKTAFAMNIAEHLAAVKHAPVGIFSLEMSKQQLAQRLLCSRSGVDSNKLRRNVLNKEDYLTLAQTVGDLHEAPLYIDDTPGLTLMQLRAKARRMAHKHDIKALFIDYLQLMSDPGSSREGRQNEVSNMSRGVKALARELRVPVVCLSQLNRAAEGREGHRPRMSDLRDSGSIEQDADVIMMIHREDYYKRGQPDAEMNHEAEIIITKQRNGPTGVVRLLFEESTTRFKNLAHRTMGDGDPNDPF